jgi:WD40 repeat protein
VLEARFSRDGELLVTCGQDSEARIFSPRGDLLRVLPGGASWVEHVAWSPVGDRFATASGRKVRVWSRDGEPFAETEELPSTVTAIAWARSGAELAATAYGGVHIWTAGSGPWRGTCPGRDRSYRSRGAPTAR